MLIVATVSVGSASVGAAQITPTHTTHGPNTSVDVHSERVNGKPARFPSVSSDLESSPIPSGVALGRAENWLSKAISVRQEALFSGENSVTTQKGLTASSRAQLFSLLQGTTSKLNSIAMHMFSDTSLTQVARRANQMVGLQVFGLVVPQIRLLARVEADLGYAAQLSAKESSAAVAIAISQISPLSQRYERKLDTTIKGLASSIVTELFAAQRILLALSPATSSQLAATVGQVKATLATVSLQLKLANADLRRLVAHLAGS